MSATSTKLPTESSSADAGAQGPKKRRLFPLMVVGGIMLVEAGVIIGAMKFMGAGPGSAEAAEESVSESSADHDEAAAGHVSAVKSGGDQVEVVVAELDAYNNVSGRLNLYRLQVCALVRKDKESAFAELTKARANTLQDRIQTVIRSAEPQSFAEPGLETLKRQIRHELERLLGEDCGLEELLIPKLLQSRVPN